MLRYGPESNQWLWWAWAHLHPSLLGLICIESELKEILFLLCSVFALLCLHLFMYGCNLFMWKSTRINYNFIFEFSPNTALKYRDAFLLCTTFMTAVVAAMVVHLLLRASGFSPSKIDAIPGILLLVSSIIVLIARNTLVCVNLLTYDSSKKYYVTS